MLQIVEFFALHQVLNMQVGFQISITKNAIN